MADSPVMGTGYLRIAGDFSQLNAQAVGLFGSSKWGKMGKAAGAALAGGLVAGGAFKGLYEIGQAFDTAADKIRVTTGANEKQLARLNKSFKNVVSDVPADFDSASTAIADLNQRLGLTGKPLQKMSKQMLELSRITDTDVKTNIESVSKSFRDWEVKTKDQTSTLDAFFRLSQKSGVSVADLASQVQKFGSPLRQLGFSLDESAAMFANFERSGVNTQTMVPGLKLAISNLTRPTDELGASMEKLGVNVGKPDVALRQVFDLMSEKGLPTVEKTGLAMDVFGKRAGADMAEAIKQGRFEVDDLLKVMKDGSETIRKAGRETMDFGEQWTLLKNNVFVALEPIAKKVFGTLGDEMKRVTDILTDRDLSKDEKFTAILDRIGKLAEKYGPKIAEAGAKIGITLIKGVAGAFVDSSILGRLFIGAAVFKLFGGKALISAGGKSMGKVIGRGMMLGIVLGLTLLIPEAWKLGKKIGEAIRRPLADVFRDLKDKFGDLMDTLTNSEQFDIQDVGGLKATTARLIEKYGTDLESVIADLAKVGVGRKRAGEAIMRALRDQDELPKIDTKNAEKSFDRIDERAKQSGKGWDRYSDEVRDSLGKANSSAGHHADRTRGDLDRVGDGLDKAREVTGKYAQGADKNFGKVTTESAQMQSGVSRNVGGMVNLVGKGLKIFASNTNKALQGFGAKEKISLALETVGGAAIGSQHGGIVKAQQGATLVPGSGSGDTVPLHIGGQLAAMVEPREQVSVLNRTATAAMMAVNKRIRRGTKHLAAGGMVDPAGPGTGVVNSQIANVVGAWSKRYDAAINYGYDPGGGHVSAGHNITGTATDTGPAAGWTSGPTRLFEQGLQAVVNAGLTVLYGSHGVGTAYPNHGYGNHAHIEWGMNPNLKGLAGAVEKIKRLLLKGPDGVPKSLGQAGLDRSWKAANALIASKTPSGIDNGGISADGAVAAVFAKTAKQLSDSKTATLALFEAGLVESGLRDLSYGDASSQGALQLLASTASGMGIDPHNEGEIASAFLLRGFWGKGGANALARTGMGAGDVAQNVQGSAYPERYAAQKGSALDVMRQYGLQQGGIVKKLAGGGKPDKSKPRGPDDVWEQLRPGSRFGDPIRGSNALQAALKAQKKIGRLGRAIGMQDERIDIADRLASLDSSPAGSELSAFERNELLDLNTTLLRKLAATGALSMQGLRLTERGMKNATGSTLSRLKGLRGTFKDSYTDTLGLTGKGGRVFDTKLNLKALRNTPLGSAATAEARAALLAEQLATLSGQLGVSQGQYGVFGDYFPRFHGGGMVPGPLGQERPIVAAGGERILTPEQQQMMVEPVIYADIYVGGEKIDERVDVRLRKVAKQTARRVPTGRI